jgi:hypothetical protein
MKNGSNGTGWDEIIEELKNTGLKALKRKIEGQKN